MSKDAAAENGEVDPLSTIDDSEYPGGLRLAAIIAALVLSIFLASLDTVRRSKCLVVSALTTPDHHHNRDSVHHQ